MTKELIERLRDTASKGVSVWGDLQMEAAKEIEILTAEREAYASAMDRMKAELAAIKAREPVAWRWRMNGQWHYGPEPLFKDGFTTQEPLYDKPIPPVREPLSDAQINEIRLVHGVTSSGRGIREVAQVISFARAIEAAKAHNMALLADVKDCQQQSRDYQALNAVIKSQMAELKAQIKAESDAHESWQNEHLKVDGEQCRQIRELEAQVAELTTAIAAQKGTA